MKNSNVAGMAFGSVTLVVLGAWFWKSQAQALSTGTPGAVPPAEPAPVSGARPQSAQETDVQRPLEAPATAASATVPAAVPDIKSILSDLFGWKFALGMFQPGDFVRRLVTTVDHLGRAHIPRLMWLMRPAAHVTRNPMLQRSYEEPGSPHRYVNDRVVEVLDQLLTTPDIKAAAKVRLPPINGPTWPTRPWVLCEFDDPALQGLSAGQNTQLRSGPAIERRLNARLAELRRRLATGTPRR